MDLLGRQRIFEICKNLYIASIKRDYPDFNLTGITITRLYHPPSISQGFSVKKGTVISRPLNVYLSDGRKYESTIEALQKKVELLKGKKVLGASVYLFVSGVLLTTTGFVLEYCYKK